MGILQIGDKHIREESITYIEHISKYFDDWPSEMLSLTSLRPAGRRPLIAPGFVFAYNSDRTGRSVTTTVF